MSMYEGREVGVEVKCSSFLLAVIVGSPDCRDGDECWSEKNK